MRFTLDPRNGELSYYRCYTPLTLGTGCLAFVATPLISCTGIAISAYLIVQCVKARFEEKRWAKATGSEDFKKYMRLRQSIKYQICLQGLKTTAKFIIPLGLIWAIRAENKEALSKKALPISSSLLVNIVAYNRLNKKYSGTDLKLESIKKAWGSQLAKTLIYNFNDRTLNDKS